MAAAATGARGSRRPVRDLLARSAAARYALAVVFATVALALTLAMGPTLQRTIFIWFFGAVILAARYCGFGPALVVAGIGILSVDLFVVPTITFRIPGSFPAL